MKKSPADRASSIENALDSFGWISRISIWLAFSLTGASFLFWSGLGVRSLALASFSGVAITAFPLRRTRLRNEFFQGLLVQSIFISHLLCLHEAFGNAPSVLLILPGLLVAGTFSGWTMKILFTSALWLIQTYWILGLNVTLQNSVSFAVGAAVSVGLLVLFGNLARYGKKIAAQELEALRGRNDFNSQRIHASRLQTMGELSAALVHELANPVTNLQGFFNQIQDSEPFRMTLGFKEISERIDVNLSRVRDLISGFRSFARMQPTDNAEFKVSQLLADLELLARHAFDSHNVDLAIDALEYEIEVQGNRVEVGQVLMNFILNALAAVKTSEIKKVRVGVEYQTAGLALYVEDTGPGVPLEFQDKIFRPFFSTKGDEGSGLGLYISKLIADSHEFKIEVMASQHMTNDVNGGARFELLVPFHRLVNYEEKAA